MGTKGKKNTPITARINSGLFNQKKSVTEPLLNVGPAGVHGNNKTKDIPSPSKMRGYAKRSPLQKTPNLEPTKVGINMLKTITAPDTIEEVETETTTEGGLTGKKEKQMSNEAWTAYLAKETPEKKASRKEAEIKRGIRKPDIVTKTSKQEVVKGKTSSSNEFTANKTRDKGDAQTSLERRNVIRSGKVGARTEKAAQRKIDKLDRKEGKTTKTRKEQRLERKRTQAESNLEVSQNAVKGAKNQSAQNISSRSDKDVLGDEQDMKLSDLGGKAAQDEAIKAGGVKRGGSPAKKKGFGMKKPMYK
jgi:hypothetical protein